ncbi:RNA 2'-phosphotransferase [Pectobacterium atrosepticum SCRI1043]|uniref:Probable RNA 2'-phosphotransferase n=1 Tax=Pectobacterium atrosepticum (strain SCRI 1043 / ATCC BAA-672) TaxID=218491 RepID=KPTA_PECAS|nr:RNA 2'-phosphotransferase [Pectobacterium atrosepticum]Q6DA62.1 RecName: Full=Probable RNA 2'-phosphotransferase [Pectobacterium atrosepticum SCRI1043]MCL6316612.1 RNA 2'-phosphotransferase [Pectobacterium atrosepticum]MCL6321155.1 RNA 2'-phosphotransferase [Pectobacterium atrosepticum]CAG73313.1 RNA 2'-phosphotransferase [Pectobacterium atrosepticum SCRI1043]
MSKKNTDISKFLSYILRHQPEAIGLSLDKEGWVVISDLILCAAEEGYIFDNNLIHSIVNNSDKKRFTISDDGLRIRAAQGHSTQQVDIRYEAKIPPEFLYHGTATRFIISIRVQGLNAKDRQYVHLSADEETAIQVGSRHGKPIVLRIKALTMYEQGFYFYQAANGVWLSNSIPYQFIQE